MPESTFEHSHRVTYAECTMGDHVYYSRYLEILEEARGELFRKLGTTFLEWQQQDIVFPVIECRLRYRSYARYDDVLTISLRVTMAEGARLNFGYQVVNQAGTMILEGETFHVCTTIAGKPKRLPEALAAALSRLSKAG